MEADRLMSATVRTDSSFDWDAPVALFSGPYETLANYSVANYDVSPDGRRFVMVKPDESVSSGQVVLVQNWVGEMERRLGGR